MVKVLKIIVITIASILIGAVLLSILAFIGMVIYRFIRGT